MLCPKVINFVQNGTLKKQRKKFTHFLAFKTLLALLISSELYAVKAI